MTYTADDLDVLTRTIWGEARGEGPLGKKAVGWTIRNRVEMDLHNDGKPDWWGEGYRGVCTCKWQYSSWNANDPNSPYLRGDKPIPPAEYLACQDAARMVLEGDPDPTDGATHYYATSIKEPAWAKVAHITCIIGHHKFYKDVP